MALFDLAGWTLDIMRRLLYLGTRTQVFPAEPGELGLIAERPVCYVLHERHLSNLLVLEQETRRL